MTEATQNMTINDVPDEVKANVERGQMTRQQRRKAERDARKKMKEMTQFVWAINVHCNDNGRKESARKREIYFPTQLGAEGWNIYSKKANLKRGEEASTNE